MLKLARIILIFFAIFLLNGNFYVQAQSNSIQVDLGVEGCNLNGVCETGENYSNCPTDCEAPPSGGGGTTVIGSIPELSIYNLSIQTTLTTATITWSSSVSTISTVKWGETTEVKEGVLTSVVYALDHKIEIQNLKSGTMYYFTIESKDAKGRTNLYPATYFFTKFLKDTAFPLNPLNAKATTTKPGILLTWQNPPDENFSFVRIMRHEDHYRGDPYLGKLIYEGTTEKFLDENVTAGKKYFYSFFSKDINGNFSTGVGVSAIAYIEEKIPTETPTEIPTEVPIEIPTEIETEIEEISLINLFFAHQYNQLVQPLIGDKTIPVDGAKNTIIDTNLKTLADDWMKIIGPDKEIMGQFLFSFNMDSGRYQSVIPPLQKAGTYNIKIYRYKDDGTLIIISKGLLFVQENETLKEAEKSNIYYFYTFILVWVQNNLDIIYIIISLIILIIFAFFLLRKKK